MKKIFLVPIVVFVAFLLSACSALLPSIKAVTHPPWPSFDHAKAAYDNITVNKTNTTELRRLGFDAFSTPNIKILTYLDIAGTMPALKEEEMDAGLMTCMKAKIRCLGYEFQPKSIKSKRYGNFWLDLFNFRRKTKDTGWQFKALVVVVDDIVVYKLWGGTPEFYEEKESVNPLGPLQESGGAILNRFFPL